MKRLLAAAVVAIYAVSALASDVRVTTMGRSDDFFMDDLSIYNNPANVSIYPNMFLGSIGSYGTEKAYDTVYNVYPNDSTQNNLVITEKNKTPQRPYFGGIVSFSLDKSQENVKQYPMFSLGAVLNRYDDKLKYLNPESDDFVGVFIDSSKISNPDILTNFQLSDSLNNKAVDYIDPLAKVDIMASLALKNGAMVGAGVYLALNKEHTGKTEKFDRTTKLIKGNVGINIPASKTIDVEASVNFGIMSLIGIQNDNSDYQIYSKDTLITADNDVFFDANVRVFSGLSAVNGDIVPKIGAKFMQMHGGDHRTVGFNAGMGLNLYIDRGFFWLGALGEYEDNDYKYVDGAYDDVKEISAKLSFGIERNVLWDWFVIRTGGTKKLTYRNIGGTNGKTIWRENAEADASDDDHLGVGIGVNVENRLKIDLAVAEDILYTFTNLLSGDSPHLFTKISASFSF